jgi:hypothetical protein
MTAAGTGALLGNKLCYLLLDHGLLIPARIDRYSAKLSPKVSDPRCFLPTNHEMVEVKVAPIECDLDHLVQRGDVARVQTPENGRVNLEEQDVELVDEYGNRLDRRHVFEGAEKLQIQTAPFSRESIAIVKRLLARTDIEQPGTFLQREYGISPDEMMPAVVLFGHRSTFYVRLDGYDVLRCSIDRSEVMDYRHDIEASANKAFREVELSIYPRIRKEISADPRVLPLIRYLTNTLTTRFSRPIIQAIKYQRAAMALGIGAGWDRLPS